MLDFLFTKT